MKIYANTDVGCKRQINEDDFCLLQNQQDDLLAVVCDGIGGAAAGEVASSLAIHTLRESFLQVDTFTSDAQVNEWIQSSLELANDRIYKKSMSNQKERGMGTTCVGCLITHGKTYVFNVGDSRLYAYYDDGLVQMTEDHSVIAQLIKEGKITKEEAKHHAQKNTLTNALGVWHVFRIDTNRIESNYKALLICSDGLHGYVGHDQIFCVIKDKKMETRQKVDTLLSLAVKAGGYDNCTVILLENED